MFIIYDFILLILALLYIPYLIGRRKWHSGLWTRLGFVPSDLRERLSVQENIWIHAVSVGEVLAIEDFIFSLRQEFPHFKIICSVVTKTGYALAQERFENKAIVIFAPLDFSWIVKKFITLIDPEIYICAETEIWPNLYFFLNRKRVPIIQINGRISDKAFKGYQRIKFILKGILNCVDIFCVQTELDASRVKALGVKDNKVVVTGNLKFDNYPPVPAFTKESLGFATEDCLWIAGSTHPGEEEIVLDVYKRLNQEFSSLRLVLVPRHIERAQEVTQLIGKAGFEPDLFSKNVGIKLTQNQVLVVDTIGQLRGLYSIAGIVFIGKSLKGGGGQNVIEPAFFGKPIVVGPLTYNFKDIIKIFLRNQALKQIADAKELEDAIKYFLQNPSQGQAMGRRAKELVEKYQGATAKTVKIIGNFLKT